MINSKSSKKYGFTLIELMVAVIIIAVLAAVAVPQYKKAILKSRFSTLMPVANSLAKGNEVYYLSQGEYSKQESKLDVEGQVSVPEGTEITLETDPEYLSYVRVSNESKVPNARYVVYQQHSKNFAGTTMCEAKDDTAKELCKGLGGVFVSDNGTEDRWASYLLSGELSAGSAFKDPCPEGAICNENDEVTGCNSGYYLYEGACRVAHTEDYDFAGNRNCETRYCKQKTFGDNSTCNTFGQCFGSSFYGESKCQKTVSSYMPYCESSAQYGTTTFTDNAVCKEARCRGAAFSGNSICDGGVCFSSLEAGVTTFTDNASCIGNAACYGSIFSGSSTCTSLGGSDYGCSMGNSPSTFKGDAVCAGTGCNTANYEEGSNACCAGSYCGNGHIRKCVWNGQTYERVGYWDDPAS